MKRMLSFFVTRVYEHWNRSWSAMKECLNTTKNGYGSKICPTLRVWLFFRQLRLRHQAGPDHPQIASDGPLIQTLNFGWAYWQLRPLCVYPQFKCGSCISIGLYYLVHQPCESYILAMKQSRCVEIKIINNTNNKQLSHSVLWRVWRTLLWHE